MPYGGTKGVINHSKGFFYELPDGTTTGWLTTASLRPDGRKVDALIPVPPKAGSTILRLLDEMLLKQPSHSNSHTTNALIAELAQQGILFDSPTIPTCANAMSSLIQGAQNTLYVRVNELLDPRVMQELIDAAERGVKVEIGYRRIDEVSLTLLEKASSKLDTLSYKNIGTTNPDENFTHANTIVADRSDAYVGSAFFWGPMRFEKKYGYGGGGVEAGVLLKFDEAAQADDFIKNFETAKNQKQQ
jgi:hypothetical protein